MRKPSKQMKKKAVRSSTTRSTAGYGFDFEDQVAAWLLLKVLTGQPLPGVEGIGKRLQMQVESLGWAIDDILLTATTSPDDQRHLAISCKSNVQVTASGLPADFVGRCWKQWAQADRNPMRRDKDKQMLVTRGRHNAFMATWSELKNCARDADVALALSRMRATAKHRKIFESVKAPAEDVGVTPSDADVVAMVDSIDVIPLDFQTANSECERLAIAQSRMLLESGSLTEGKRLWRELVGKTRNVRLGSGTLEISDLWKRLRSDYALRDHPDYESSWQKLRALTQDHKGTIETALPSGQALDRKGAADKLLEWIAEDVVCVVFGESGSGKSALVKTVLNERFPNDTQVWFGPDNFELAINEATRARLGIDQPLIDVLNVSAQTANFLVIDAAERLSHDCVLKAKVLIEELKSRNASLVTAAWRILIVGQTEAWIDGTLQELAGAVSPRSLAVEGLPLAVVGEVLCSVSGLEWLATHSGAVSALTNLRTLAWVIHAAGQFQRQDGSVALSLTAIADRLWIHWTDNKPSVQRLLVRLAEREADFEHSFAISELESGDAVVFDARPVACPLRVDETGRIRFQHDLAADWARYHRLKEIADDTLRWAQFAANPFWHGALRMLGQLLLRQQVETHSAWDVAFEAAEQNREAAPLADDILLEALFLDPNAEAFLDQRADMLLANGGARLLRLVNRFEHVASVPCPSPDMQGRLGDLSLYIEAHFRTSIFARWPAMARFLTKYRDIVAKMTSPAIASLCERWLTSTPPVLQDGTVMPFRREFAELALANAREVQLGHAKGNMRVGESGIRIYQAALAGASDLPSDVSEWALEMAQRRAYRVDILEKVKAHHAEQTAKHERRMASDPSYRERHEQRTRWPTSIFSLRKLPPWALGPQRRLEGQFREAVLRSAGFHALMRTNAAVSGEVLLACVIEDEPEDDYGSSGSADDKLGIKFNNEAYPTAPWKSPFYPFLRINSDTALDYLHHLVNFSTDRWVDATRKRSRSDPVILSLRLADGTAREYMGNYWVFTWSHQNSLSIGQLYSALAALERWLCDLIDSDVDVAPQIDALLRATNSVAVLGVLVNVGKYHDELFKGPLRPLLGVQELYGWDLHRVKESAYAFDEWAWARSGEIVFEMAKGWVLAPYRKRKFREIIHEMIAADKAVGAFVVATSNHWVSPITVKEALEFRLLVAELNPLNYVAVRVERLEFERWHRRHTQAGKLFGKEPERRLSGNLADRFLEIAFAWLFGTVAGRKIPNKELETHRQLAAAFWAHQAWWQSGSGKDENDDYEPMHQLGYKILEELARLIIESPTAVAPGLWRPVFVLGPKGHYAIGHFLTCWFNQLTEVTVVAEFAQRWRPMIEFMVLDEEWVKGGPWYYGQQLERQILGFGASECLKRVPDHAKLVGMMRDLFGIWAKKRLTRDEDNLAGFCGFLGNEAGKPLRLDGLQWIADAMNANPNLGKWYRDRTSTAFMEFLDVLVLEHAAELGREDKARQALLLLSAHAASRQLTAALALHERVRRLLAHPSASLS